MNLLDKIELFTSLNDTERRTLALYCQERFLQSGEILFNEGDDAVAMYIVESGSLKVYKDRSDGEKILGFIGPGELAGEMAFFDPDAPKKRMASIKSIDDTLLFVIMDYAILELSKRHPEIYEKIFQIVMKRKTLSL